MTMPNKITFIGAGSVTFTRNLVRDILTFPAFQDCELALMDIDAENLSLAKQVVDRIVATGGYPATVTATLDRAEALDGADGVLTTILTGDDSDIYTDMAIPKAYGISINVGDTRGPSAIFRFMRTWPAMLEIVRDIEAHCPDAIFLNYTNPMAMLCRAMQRERFVPQRTGHSRDAGPLDRCANGRDHLPLRGHQPPGPLSGVQVEWQGRLSPNPRGSYSAPRGL
jgi:alpha-galactosidase